MIRNKLRSTLMMGTVLINAIALGSPAECLAAPASPRTTPLTPSALPQLPSSTRIPVLKRVDSSIIKASKKSLKDVRLGLASWYGTVFEGRRTANGEVFDGTQLTAASNTLPMGTRVKVTNLHNGRAVIVRINDRGLLSPGRIIDLSSAAAEKIGLLRAGVGPVQLDIVAAGA
jgi:rare lipoprotein A